MEADKTQANVQCISIGIPKRGAASTKPVMHAVNMFVEFPKLMKHCVESKEPSVMDKHGSHNEWPNIEGTVVHDSAGSEHRPDTTDGVVQWDVWQADSQDVAGRMLSKRLGVWYVSADDAIVFQP